MYTFNIVGVSPVLYFFNQQQEVLHKTLDLGVEYVSSYECTLDALIYSVETATARHDWRLDEVVGTVVSFWMNNSEAIRHWKNRLQDSGKDSLLVSRVADVESLRIEFNRLFQN